MAARCAFQGRKKNRYQDPSKRKKRRVLTEEEKEAARQAAALRKAERERAAAELAAQRSFRRSTKAKTDAASKARAAEERQRKVSASDSSRRDDRWALNVCFCCSNQAAARKRPAPVKSVALTAQEVFLEAAKTVVENTRSLEALLKVKDANRSQGPPKAPVQGRRIIRRSRVGCADSITFTEVDDFPAVINAVAPPCMLWPCLGLLWKVAADVCVMV